MILRGAKITGVSLTPKPKTIESTLYLTANMTHEMAEEMGWGCLFDPAHKPTNGWASIPLKGEVSIVSAKLKPSDKTAKCEITAVQMKGFAAHRRQEKGQDGFEFYISFQITSSDEQFEQCVGPYLRGHLNHTSQLVVEKRQMGIPGVGRKEEEEDEDEAPAAADPKQQTLPSVSEMKRRGVQ